MRPSAGLEAGERAVAAEDLQHFEDPGTGGAAGDGDADGLGDLAELQLVLGDDLVEGAGQALDGPSASAAHASRTARSGSATAAVRNLPAAAGSITMSSVK